jgi:hypothetical protein
MYWGSFERPKDVELTHARTLFGLQDELDLTSTPPEFLSTIQARLDSGASFVPIELTKPEQFPEMAGILLEYPVIYALNMQATEGGTYLDGIPLILIRVWLVKDNVHM